MNTLGRKNFQFDGIEDRNAKIVSPTASNASRSSMRSKNKSSSSLAHQNTLKGKGGKLADVGLSSFEFGNMYERSSTPNASVEQILAMPSTKKREADRNLYSWGNMDMSSNIPPTGKPAMSKSLPNLKQGRHSPAMTHMQGRNREYIPPAKARASTASMATRRSNIASDRGLVSASGVNRPGMHGISSRSHGISAASLLNAPSVQNPNGTWQFVSGPAVDGKADQPITRLEVEILLKMFADAMAVSNSRIMKTAETGAGMAMTGMEGFVSPVQNDYFAMRGEVGSRFSERRSLNCAMIGTSSHGLLGDLSIADLAGGGGNGGAYSGKGYDPVLVEIVEALGDGIRNCLETPRDGQRFLAQASGLNRERWETAQTILSTCMFEQKWADLACGELINQISISCLEHGNLLRQIRLHMAGVVQKISKLYSDSLWHLDRCIGVISRMRLDYMDRERSWKDLEATMKSDYSKAVQDMEAEHQKTVASGEKVKAESRDKVRDMGDTLRTLNKIFADMKSESETLSRSDLNHRIAHLEEQVKAKDAELEELRFIKQDLTSTKVQIRLNAKENEQLKEENEMIRAQLEQKDNLIQSMLERTHKNETEIEAMRYKNQKNINDVKDNPEDESVLSSDDDYGDKSDNDDMDTINTEEQGQRLKKERRRSSSGSRPRSTERTQNRTKKGVRFEGSSLSISPGDGGEYNDDEEEVPQQTGPVDVQEELGTSVLCIRCRKELDDLNNIREALAGGQQVQKLQCYAFRLLLPNLKGYRPPRRVNWVRAVMRAILKAKIRDDAMLSAAGRRTTRFPEFVFSWFEPTAQQMEAAHSEQMKNRLVDEADNNRWALYYGVKSLARESAEAKLFWGVLDESFGEDYISFFLYCLMVLEGCAGHVVRLQWGGEPHNSWKSLKLLLEEEDQTLSRGDSAMRKLDAGGGCVSGKEVIWVELRDAQLASQLIMVKAFGEYKSQIQETINNLADQSTFKLPGFDENPDGKDPFCVDMYQWLRVMMHSYKEEQCDRRAAVRLMFETAATGVLTDETPVYGSRNPDYPPPTVDPNNVTDDEDDNPSVDLPQFNYIIKTLCKRISLAESTCMFREAHDGTKGKVNLTSFLEVADRWQFFTRTLHLPPFFAAEDYKDISLPMRWQIGSTIHRHIQMIRPRIKELMDSCPESSRELFLAAEEDLDEALRVATKGANIDGVRPLSAYRRFLNMALHSRILRHEAGAGYSWNLKQQNLRPENCVLLVERELRMLSNVLMDFQGYEERINAFDHIRELMLTIRIQRTWRKRLWREQGPPTSLLVLMRCGYMRGLDNLRNRRVHAPARLTLAQVAELFQAFAVANQCSRELFQNAPSFPQTVFMFFMNRWGIPELAERALHDLFYNARLLANHAPRVRLFCAFLGLCFSNDDKAYTSREGLMFYLRVVAAVNRVKDNPTAAVTQWHPDNIVFEESVFDGRGRPYWREQTDILKIAIKRLFPHQEEEVTALQAAIKDLPTVDYDKKDVDGFLLLIMQHWRRMASQRRQLMWDLASQKGGEMAEKYTANLDTYRSAEKSLQVIVPMAMGEHDLEYLSVWGYSQVLYHNQKVMFKLQLPDALSSGLNFRCFVDYLIMGDFVTLKWELSAASLEIFIQGFRTYMPIVNQSLDTIDQEIARSGQKEQSRTSTGSNADGEMPIQECIGRLRDRIEIMTTVFDRLAKSSVSSSRRSSEDSDVPSSMFETAPVAGINSAWRNLRQIVTEFSLIFSRHSNTKQFPKDKWVSGKRPSFQNLDQFI